MNTGRGESNQRQRIELPDLQSSMHTYASLFNSGSAQYQEFNHVECPNYESSTTNFQYPSNVNLIQPTTAAFPMAYSTTDQPGQFGVPMPLDQMNWPNLINSTTFRPNFVPDYSNFSLNPFPGSSNQVLGEQYHECSMPILAAGTETDIKGGGIEQTINAMKGLQLEEDMNFGLPFRRGDKDVDPAMTKMLKKQNGRDYGWESEGASGDGEDLAEE